MKNQNFGALEIIVRSCIQDFIQKFEKTFEKKSKQNLKNFPKFPSFTKGSLLVSQNIKGFH